jgi:hypothetical protein
VADVVIERCAVRVIRRGGWSWGSSRDAIVEVARRALPRLLARRLEALWDDDVEGELAQPQHVRVKITVAQLAAIVAEQRRGTLSALDSDDPAVAVVDEVLARAVARLAGKVAAPRRLPSVVMHSSSPPDVDRAGVPAPAGVADIIRRWHRSGVLAVRLRGLKTAALRAWLTLLSSADPRSSAGVDVTNAARAEASDVRSLHAEDAADIVAPADHRATVSDEHAALIARAIAWAERDARDNPPAMSAASVAVERRQPASSPSLPTQGRALPFLLLPPLAQIGFLDALAASFAAVGRSDVLAAFAVGLALKVLPPPERGWRRRADDVASAAAIAARAALPDELTVLADENDEALWSPLAVALTQPVLEAHTAGQPFFAIPVDGTQALLVDGEGLFPVAYTQAAELPALLGGATGPLGVPRALATPALLAALDAAGIEFFTDAPPVRGEHWNAVVVGPGERVWTNTSVARSLVASWRGLVDATVDVPPLWRALTAERPLAPAARAGRFDAIVAQAAMLGLAFIAWTLWRDKGAAHPSLALSRFSDLDARLTFSDAAIDVVLPLGRRAQDLRARRLLNDVAPPWLHPRTVRFGGV